jgi:hypothetical protein
MFLKPLILALEICNSTVPRVERCVKLAPSEPSSHFPYFAPLHLAPPPVVMPQRPYAYKTSMLHREKILLCLGQFYLVLLIVVACLNDEL